jgi:hypothetical protein
MGLLSPVAGEALVGVIERRLKQEGILERNWPASPEWSTNGSFIVSVNKLALLMVYIGVALTILVTGLPAVGVHLNNPFANKAV